MASSEWMLGVQIQQFQSLYNAEIMANNQYCCCDIPNTCEDNITALENIYDCTLLCDIYFVVSLQDCNSTIHCNINQTFNLEVDPLSRLSSVILLIPFEESALDVHVRTVFFLVKQIKFNITLDVRASTQTFNESIYDHR